MSDIIRVYVGTDCRMSKAEKVLEHSIRKHSTLPVEFTWMRACKGDPDWGECWKRGREMYRPYSEGWATDFTCFRWTIPELCGFEGKAIYLDADMYVRKDIKGLWESPLKAAYSCVGPRTDVALIDCAAFSKKNFPEWPSIEKMKKSGWKIGPYTALMQKHKKFNMGGLAHRWDCLDGRGYDDKTCLVHFTNMRTQPWKPWPKTPDFPEGFIYPPHKCKVICDEFWALYKEATSFPEPQTA